MPPKPACLLVGSGLLGAAYCLLALADFTPELGPHWLYRVGIWALTVLLLLRGLAGPPFSLRGEPEFVRWNGP
ncbi:MULTISPECIES: DUF3995 domain-containing protein [Streptomyces]|nr:DUF3995 domain-containing protein [Streptomyces sp. H39-C1]MCZ4102087.1 DUF3995 domain-containing protein [Streptomyces sp. H39-C1]